MRDMKKRAEVDVKFLSGETLQIYFSFRGMKEKIAGFYKQTMYIISSFFFK